MLGIIYYHYNDPRFVRATDLWQQQQPVPDISADFSYSSKRWPSTPFGSYRGPAYLYR